MWLLGGAPTLDGLPDTVDHASVTGTWLLNAAQVLILVFGLLMAIRLVHLLVSRTAFDRYQQKKRWKRLVKESYDEKRAWEKANP